MVVTNEWLELIQAIKDHMEKTGMSQSGVARALGISPAALSQFLKETYPSPHKLFGKIRAFLAVDEAREVAPQKPDFVHTSQSQAVLDIITYCHVANVLGIVYGDAGIGKTEAIREYARNHPEAVVITMSPAFGTTKGVTEKLAKALKVQEGRSIRRMYEEINEKLVESGRVIIVDEAQHLPLKALDHLRSIADESGVGMVLIGNEEVYTRMTGRGEAAFAQLFSRISMRKNVRTELTQPEDMELLFPHLQEEERNFLLRISRSKYGIRGAVNVYVNSAANQNVKLQGLVDMARYMGIGA
ncbi:AAA family ATPase [Brevibacillus sp. SYSU BS000544]|uniref:AAA family ATPase n=1 Tax=Brevibacillus sp. SYSU BS000544 TaxID=3416443 RepID=UPI003CE5B62C